MESEGLGLGSSLSKGTDKGGLGTVDRLVDSGEDQNPFRMYPTIEKAGSGVSQRLRRRVATSAGEPEQLKR